MEDKEIIKMVAEKNKVTLDREPHRYTSGIINHVYDLDKFVLKIEDADKHWSGILKPQKEIISKLINAGAKVPKIFDTGEYDGRHFILMEKIAGNNLSYDWFKFNSQEKESIIEQIAHQLQIFHSIQFDNYSINIQSNKKFNNLKEAIQNLINFEKIDKSKLKKEYIKDLEYIEGFYKDNIDVLDEQSTAVLVHNDISFENIFHKNGKLTGIIDFDWASAAPKDYELWAITILFYEPQRRVEEKLEPLYKSQMIEEYKLLKKYYPALFEVSNLANRVRLYLIEDIIDRVAGYQKGRWSESVMLEVQKFIKQLYKGDWLLDIFN